MLYKCKRINGNKNVMVKLERTLTDQILVWLQWHEKQLNLSVFHYTQKTEAMQQFDRLVTKYENSTLQ